ncbi:Proteasome activator BLM10 [Marasmius crinis-equi]|uniref:Proteasome activator BLM10 n=1 Tax=Marasmius crinis-equi TaxID=585013 RepID=A0ABR3FWQ8_9AGAR
MSPDISSLSLHDPGPNGFGYNHKYPEISEESDDRYVEKLKNYTQSLPYSVEPYSKMMQMLDFILLRIVQCIEAKDFDVGFIQWDSMVTYWSMLKYPIPKEKRILLAKLYFHVSITPGMSAQVIATCADGFKVLTQSKKKISVKDMRLPWKPIFDILKEDLFLDRRQFEYTQLSWCMGYIAENSRRFFHPAAVNDMLSTFLPLMDGTVLDSILSSQYYLLSFLPLSHPQSYLPMLMRMWESINSYVYDERMLHFLAKLAEMHVTPEPSDPRKIAEFPDDEISEGEKQPRWSQDDVSEDAMWHGVYKDVGIFTEHEWSLLMCKCLASMEIPLADSGSLTTGPSADNQAGFEIGRLPKPNWRISSLARIIVYSMAPDGMPAPPSSLPTPFFTPLPSGMNTPAIQTSTLKDYLSAPLGKGVQSRGKTFVAGSKALDSLVRFIASIQDFFHVSNSGSWTNDDGTKKGSQIAKPRRAMRRELVKSLRTVCLLAMFSQDSSTVSNIQSCLKSMSVMEPDLILHPILERAVPSLEALVELGFVSIHPKRSMTFSHRRTIAVIKALGAVAPALVSREVYYPGAKYLVPILDLLIPGIDLNDPSKTLCTTAFLVEISQYIKFGDLTTGENGQLTPSDAEYTAPKKAEIRLPDFSLEEGEGMFDLNLVPRLSDEEEDMLLKVVQNRYVVIQLMENLPEEGPNGTAGGASETQVVNAVAGACNQICVHLSEPLYDLVLKMVFEYASTNVRSNAVRAIHQLVECIANANPEKTLAMFLPFCERNIRLELENGASSLRTTSSSAPIPSDATLHWNLAILRGTVYNDGRAALKYKDNFLSLLKLLHTKALSKRGFSWTGKLLSSLLLTLTHTYPLENKFVNPDEWSSKEFEWNHHQHWGKLYAPGEVKVSWHVPNQEEIDFAVQIFRELIEPTLSTLEELAQPGVSRDAVWRNDFCRHLSLVRNAFSGIPTLMKEYISPEELRSAAETSDILHEIPEMIASCEPLSAGFCLVDPSDARYRYMSSLRDRFGKFLHEASVSLRQQGEENTVDAVQMLLRSIKTYLLEYGDHRDGYYVNQEQYISAKNVARQYAKQKVWPRAVYVRQARFYHSARLRWNSIERLRGPQEDELIDDIAQWSMWHYAIIRIQALLESICAVYDGVRRRALPLLYDALKKSKDLDDDRMKGALWTLNLPSFAKYVVSEPTLATDMFVNLLGCQHNEKQSIQTRVSVVMDTCLGSFTEPNYVVYDIPIPYVDKVVEHFKVALGMSAKETALINKCSHNVIRRLHLMNEAADATGAAVMDIGKSPETHWRYAIVALRCLRTLIRRDKPLTPAQMTYFLERVHDSHPTIRYYAQRGVMKGTRNIKLRSYCPTLIDLYKGKNYNPLKVSIDAEPSHATTLQSLKEYRTPIDLDHAKGDVFLLDKTPPGWLTLPEPISVYKIPAPKTSTFVWEEPSAEAIAAARKVSTDRSFWKKLSNYLAEETHDTTMTQDNVSNVKSIFQLLEDAPFEALRPQLESLLAEKEPDKQRAAAELLAGVIGGSKHWPLEKQKALWKWYKPYIAKTFGPNLKSDTVGIWTSFIEYLFYNRDPRRIQPLFDHVLELFKTLDYSTELSFDAVKILSLFRACYEQLGRKISGWIDEIVERCWSEIHSEHEDVRAYVAEILAFADKIKWQPRPTIPSAETFAKECRVLPITFDIMGMRGTYHKNKVDELVGNLRKWSEVRVPGVRAFQSDYDRAGVTVCKWLFQSLHDTNAISVFDYILPLMPELFRFIDLSDSDDLASRAKMLLVRMCGVSPPRPLINQILDQIFEAIQSSPSWRVRLKALPLVQIFYFRQFFLISDMKITEILEVVCKCLDDEVVEVREMAATTLSGILRLSPRSSVQTLKVDTTNPSPKNSHIPDRQDPTYAKSIRQRHAAILGICALVDSYPYTVQKWMPDLLTNVLAEYTYDPIPISNTVRKCARNFKKTHQDTWHEDSKRFDDSQLVALSTLLTGSSYYA